MFISKFELNKGKTFIIAELSANHGGSLDNAVKTIEAAKRAGADAVKLQTYTADTISVKNNGPEFTIKGGLWDGFSYYDLYEKASTPWHWHETLKKTADNVGIILFSSPFDTTAVDFLENLDMPAYKIASFEINDIPLIKYTARLNKPVIISTGTASKEEINNAVSACKDTGNHNVILLKCTSSYPAPTNEANLKMIPKMAKDFNCLTGLSDHTLNNNIAVSAVSLGACVIEKHFILDKSIESPDKAFSLDEKEMTDFINTIRLTEEALGCDDYTISKSSMQARKFMRSLYALKDIEKGETFSYSNIGSFRPNLGISPKYFYKLEGKKALEPISKGTPITEDILKNIK